MPLRISIDLNLNFNKHIPNICESTSRKLNAMPRVSSRLNYHQEKVFFKDTMKAYFSYRHTLF